MICSLAELRNKEVVNVKTGMKIGYVDDVEIDTLNSSVVALVVYGRPKCMGILGRDEDVIIKCRDIELIGEDTILVSFEETSIYTKSRSFSVENLLK